MSIGSGSKVTGGDGRELTLGVLVKSGGAGSIYRIDEHPELVAKIYHPQTDVTVYEHKVEAMLALVPDLPDLEVDGAREVQLTWPRLLLRDRRRRFLGYAMPLVDFQASAELECVLQERQARRAGLPTGLGAHVTLAANLAGVIAELHRREHYVVDLKPVNLRFYRRSLHVTMLDCDGCSIKGVGERFRAPQYTPEYLAPELHGHAIGEADEESQDRFALAVVVFQLLNFGIHPFTGRPSSDRVPTDIPGRIARRCYAYGQRSNADMAPNPASGHTAMPAELRALCDRAFTSEGSSRPSAGEWAALLRDYARRSANKVLACSRQPDHEHFAGLPCATCARGELLHKAKQAAARRPAATARAPQRFQSKRQVVVTPVAQPPSLTPSRGPAQVLAFLVAIGVAAIFIGRSSACDCDGRHRAAALFPSEPGDSVPWQRHLPRTTELREVIQVARNGNMEEILAQLRRLPGYGFGGENQKECQAALSSWWAKTEWTEQDPDFAKLDLHGAPSGYTAESVVRAEANGRGPCTRLYYLGHLVVRTAELCKLRQHSPGFYGEVGEKWCAEQQVTQAAVDTLSRSIVFAQSNHGLVWDELAHAFVLIGDHEAAYASFVISAVSFGQIGLKRFFSLPMLREPWLRQRAEILQARARSKVRGWAGEQLEEDEQKALALPWPDEPPPKTKVPANAHGGRAKKGGGKRSR